MLQTSEVASEMIGNWEWCQDCRRPFQQERGALYCKDPECMAARAKKLKQASDRRRYAQRFAPSRHMDTIYRLVWEEGYRIVDVDQELGMSVRHCVKKLVRTHGRPEKNCRCGLPGLHRGVCRGTGSPANPHCPHCGGTSSRKGSTGKGEFRRRVYRCHLCRKYFLKVRMSPSPKEVEERRRKVYQGIWVDLDKVEYVAVSIGVNKSTVSRDVQALMQQYGPPPCACGRARHRGLCPSDTLVRTDEK